MITAVPLPPTSRSTRHDPDPNACPDARPGLERRRPVTAQVQPNSPSATLLLDAKAGAGFERRLPVLVASSDTVDFTLAGAAGAPYAVFLGMGIEPGVPFGPHGIANLSLTGLGVAVDGISSPGTAMLDGTGTAFVTSPVVLPPGTDLGVQAAVVDIGLATLSAPGRMLGVPGDPIPASFSVRAANLGFTGLNRHAVVGDINGDTIPDIVNSSGVFLGDGQLGFSYVAADPPGIELGLADLIGDSNPDLVVVDALVEIYLGDGSGVFTTPAISLSATCEDRGDLRFVDFDLDGDLDLLLSTGGTTFAGVMRFQNQNGIFPVFGPTFFSGSRACEAADLTGDGKPEFILDLVPAAGSFPAAETRILWGNFTPTQNLAFSAPLTAMPQAGSLWLRAAELNGDSAADLVWASETSQGVLINSGGAFPPTFSYVPIDPPSTCCPLPSPQPVDIDDDGDTDVCWVVRDLFGLDWLAVAVNDGTATFGQRWYIPLHSAPGTASHVIPADLDGDGDTDLVVGGAPTTIIENQN